MKKLITLIIFAHVFQAINLFAQSDSILLTGASRNYEDSLVLRWNTRSHQAFAALQKLPIFVETITEEGNWIRIGQSNAVPLNRWKLSKLEQDRNRLLAAGLLQQFQNESKRPVSNEDDFRQKQENLRYFWINLSLTADLDASVSQACNLRFTIHHPPFDKVTQYRIYAVHPLYFSDTLFYVVAPKKYTAEKAPALEANERDGAVSLRWKAERQYSGYYVEKADAGIGNWIRLNKAPIVIPSGQNELFYTDSVRNYQPADYRVYGIDLFGDKSLRSLAVRAQGRDLTPPPRLSGFKVQEMADKTILLPWDKPQVLNGESGIAIGMKHRNFENYLPLSRQMKPITTVSFKVPVKKDESEYYFLLQVYDTAGNSSASEAFIQLEDNTAPAVPQGLIAQVNESGIVALRWHSNKEPDLRGYLIYFSNSPKAEFSGLVNNPMEDTLFMDTLSLKMLNREVFYGVEAVDHRMNRSGMSPMVKVLRPDTLPPVAPVFRSYLVGDSFIRLSWYPSSSADVISQKLLRLNTKSRTLVDISLKPWDSTYLDAQVTEGEQYKYTLIAFDENKNHSSADNSLLLNTYRQTYLNPVSNFRASFDSISNLVLLQWDNPGKPVAKAVIYKGKSKDSLAATSISITDGRNEAIDTRITPDVIYYYSVKLIFNDGRQTKLCQPVAVSIR